ncbi:hypothetical protein HCH_05493 [Hahella chejuensis KCTC 2396]|uniref:Uncharacterized protein n=1 Tax=Hahella chejuensis (strain KCTC 2396) TaxID=349521 RepID=Q2SB18_HAHCH|nr:hypothetical protein HCH_05493 [Hahella chejuensis KCTC 2396]
MLTCQYHCHINNKMLPFTVIVGGTGSWLLMKHCAKLIEQESNEVS